MNVNLYTSQFITDSVSWLDTKNNTIMSGDLPNYLIFYRI